MKNTTTSERELRRKLPGRQSVGLQSAKRNSKTRLLGKGSPGQLKSIGKLPKCAESYSLKRGQYMFNPYFPEKSSFRNNMAASAAWTFNVSRSHRASDCLLVQVIEGQGLTPRFGEQKLVMNALVPEPR